MWGSVSQSGRALDGVAVVSDIVASPEPREAAKKISEAVKAFKALQQPAFHSFSVTSPASTDPHTPESLKQRVGECLQSIRKFSPLVHQVCFLSTTPASFLHCRIIVIIIISSPLHFGLLLMDIDCRSPTPSLRINLLMQRWPLVHLLSWQLHLKKWKT